MPIDPQFVRYLQQALDSPRGEGIELNFLDADSANAYRQKLYPVRKAYPEYRAISILRNGCRLWLVNRGEPDQAHDLAEAG